MALKLIQGKQLNVNLTGSFTGSFSGSFNGTSSYATQALSASYALSSSYSTNISGTTNYVSKFTGDNTLGNSLIYDNGTNVGIGTTAPTAKLEVAGDIIVNGITIGKGSGSLSNNTVVGEGAGESITTGNINSFFGLGAGRFNTVGQYNAYIGQAAGYNTTSGSYNSFLGSNAGFYNTLGNYNTFIGLASGQFNTSGSGNTALGNWSGYLNTTGSYNTFVGYGTGYYIKAGDDNVFLGRYAGRYIGTGTTQHTLSTNSIFLGVSTRPAADNETNQIVVGYNATGLGSNTIVLGNDSVITTALKGNIAIGKTTPNAKLDVSGSVIITGSLTVTRGITGSLLGTASYAQNAGTASHILGGSATHIPFFKTDTTLATSSMYQSGSGTIIINQDNATTANPEALYVWQPHPTSFNVVSGKGNVNNYLQLNIHNTNQGTNASSDVVATADNGNETINYVDMGINSENFSGPIGGPNDAYLYSAGQHLHIGNITPNKPIQFFVGGPDSNADRKLELNANGQHNMTGSLEIDESLTVLGGITGSLLGTASYALQALSASWAPYQASASYALSSSYAETASYAPSYLPLTGGTINGDVIVNGTASIAFLNVQFESASVIYSSGSNVFGDAIDDTQTLNGTVLVSGSQQITGSLSVSQGITGTLFGTASYALTASYLNGGTNGFVQGGNSFNTTALLGTNDNQSLAIETSGSTRMFISSSGNVGIGTTSPTSKLHIQAPGSGSTDIALRVRNSADTGDLMTMDGFGKLSINTTTNLATISILSSGNASRLQFQSSAYNNIQANGVVPFYFDFNENLNFRGSVGATQIMRLVGATSNVLINTTTDNGGKLQIVAPGTGSTDIALQVRNNANTANILTVAGNGASTLTGNFTATALISTGDIACGNKLYNNNFYVENTGATNIGSGQSFAPASAILCASSTTRGFLPPRTNLTSNITAPAQGLITYLTGSTNEGLYYYNSGSTPGWRQVADTTNAFIQGGNSFGTTALLGTNDNQSLALETSGSTRMFVSSSGNVGIGTTAPTRQLHIKNIGTADANKAYLLIDADGTIDGAATIRLSQNNLNWNTTISTHTSAGGANYGIQVNDGGTPTFVTNKGKMFIGNIFAIPSASLHVKGSGTTSGSTSFLVENSNRSPSLAVLDNGHVGIGTLLPSASLHVSRSIIAVSSSAQGVLFTNTLSSSAHGNSLIGLDIAPTFNNGAFTGSANIDLRTKNAGVVIGSGYGYGSLYGPTTDGIIQITEGTNDAYGSFKTQMWFRPSGNAINLNSNYWSRLEQDNNGLKIIAGNYQSVYLKNLSVSGYVYVGGNMATNAIAIPASTANVLINTTVDNGAKLQVNGNTTITGSLLQSGSSTFNGGNYLFKANATGDAGIRIDNSINGYTSLNWTSNSVGLGLMAGGGIFAKVSTNAGLHIGDTATSTSLGATLGVFGNAKITSGLTVTGSLIAPSITGSLLGTSSWAVSASWAPTQTIDTGSLVTTASFNSFTSSYNTGSFTGSFTGSLLGIASNSLTASYINPLTQNVTITGSFLVSGSTTQIGDNNLLGNTYLSGSINISGNTFLTGSLTALNQTASFGYVSASFLDITGKQVVKGFTQYLPTSDIVPIDTVGGYIYSSGSEGDLYFAQTNGSINNVIRLRWLEGNMYSGLLNGGVITTQSSTVYQVSSGSGIIVSLNGSLSADPYPAVQYISWSNLSSSIAPLSASYDQSFVAIEASGSTGIIYTQGTPYDDGQFNSLIPIGNVIHQNRSSINATATYPSVAYGYKQRSSDFIRAFGPLKLSGLDTIVSGSSTGSLQITSGKSYSEGRNYVTDVNNPSYVQDTGQPISKIFRYYQSGSSWVYLTNGGAGFETIDPTQYSLNGVLTPVPGTGINRAFTIQRVFYFPGGATKGIYVYYGNQTYATALDAIANIPYESFIEAPNTSAGAVLSAYVIVRNNADFTDTDSYNIRPAGLFRNIGGTGGAGGAIAQTLSGLSDVDVLTTLPTNGQPLVYDSATLKWTNKSTLAANLTGTASFATTASYVSGVVATASFAATASYLTNGTNAFIQNGNSFGTTALLGTNDNQSLALETSGSERMRITSTGDIGIGTTNPGVKFQITQQAISSYPTLGTASGGFFLSGDTNVYGLYAGINSIDGNTWFQAMQNNSPTAYNILLNPVGGNVGIGSTTANARLYVRAPGALATDIAFRIRNNANTLDLFNVNGAGNVGIGTTSPNAKLDVSGSAIISGSLTVTQGITGSLFGTAATASYAPSYLPLTGGTITGDVTVLGTASIAFLNVQYESASVIYSSGSNVFGDATNDTQTLVGTVLVSGSQQITGSLDVSGGITGSLFGTASYALTSSYLSNGTNAFIQGGNLFGTTALLGTNDDQALALETNGSEKMRVTSTGLVGIGTSLPSASLHVRSATTSSLSSSFYVENSAATASFVVKDNGAIGAGIATPVYRFQVNTPVSTDAFAVTNGGSSIRLMPNAGLGNPGIASSGIIHMASPINGTGGTEVLQVRKAGGANFIQYWSSNAGTTLSAVDGTGRLGIGTGTAPLSASLHIKGATSSSLSSSFLIENPAATASFSVLDNGFVGISNGAPTVPLEIGRYYGGTPAIIKLWSGASTYAQLDGRDAILDFNMGGGYAAQISRNGGYKLAIPANSQFAFGNANGGSSPIGTLDTGISRISAGKVSIGNGTVGNTSGILIASGIGIGTTTPSGSLHIMAPGALSTDIALRVRNSADTADLMTVNGLGNVGIGAGISGVAYNINFNVSLPGGGLRGGIVWSSGASILNRRKFSGANDNTLSFLVGTTTELLTIQERNSTVLTNNIGINNTNPDVSAILDIASTTKGLLPPRMTTTQRDAIATPATGLVVYDSTLLALSHYNGSAWAPIGVSSFPYTGTAVITGSLIITSTLQLDGTLTDYATVNSTIVGDNNLYTQATGSYTSAFIKYSLNNGANSRAGEFIANWNGTTVTYFDNSTTDIGTTSDIVFTSAIVSSQIQVNATAATSGWKIKTLATFI